MARAKENVGAALTRGLMCRCPSCGEGKLFAGYLAVAPVCTVCGEDLGRLRAADGPAFMTMLLVCLSLIPTLWLGFVYIPNPLALAGTVSVVIVALALVLLRLVKGAWLAFEWVSARNA
ncbi:zinc-finger protein (plasmid) [Ketogulonicigenium robustum]|uniref:Zinc-finger protein n=1 Tax=Ketogulonicigenium robustum TaxID=92947 RepID=A0A1W6P2V9_9RHOB|nr:zinc-finger protein [Ketogulonicigenium robustum]